MGRPKLLLPWLGTTILGHLIAQWKALHAAQIAVVHSANDPGLAAELDRLGIPFSDRISNPAPELGMFRSIQCSAEWTGWDEELSHWAIVLGDQPHLSLHTLRSLLGFAAEHAGCICQPSYQGRPRHPVILPRAVFAGVPSAPDSNLKELLARFGESLALLPVNDPGLNMDLDTPADYEAALRTFAAESRGPQS